MPSPIPHGGGIQAAQARHPDAPTPWLDLSTGINPVPYPIGIPPAALARLPEPEDIAALERAAAHAYRVAGPAMVAAIPGTQSLLQWLPYLAPPGRVAVVSPTYAEHAACWRAAGREVQLVPDLGVSAEIVVVGNPNNPDGRRHSAAALLAQAARAKLLVVDEAFADFEAVSLAEALPHPGLLLLRSFGKAFGLAGVRLGFALCDAAMAAAIRQALGPWAVNGIAVHAGRIALADGAWRTAAASRLAEDAARLDATLVAAGCTILGGTRLFRLATHPAAPGLAHRLATRGILVRQFADAPDQLRFGVPDAAGCARLEAALA